MKNNWYKTAAYGRNTPTFILAKVVDSFSISEEDANQGRAMMDMRLRSHSGKPTVISLKEGQYVGTYKQGNLWMITILDISNGPSKFLLGISEELAKQHLKSEKDATGKPIQSNNVNELLNDLQKRNYYNEQDISHKECVDSVIQFAIQNVEQLLKNNNLSIQDVKNDNSINHGIRYLFNIDELKKRIIDLFNTQINNTWSTKGLGAKGLTATLKGYIKTDIDAFNEFLKAKAGKSKQQLMLKRKEEEANRMGKMVCPRCGGLGGSNAWDATGWTCFECGGSGIVDLNYNETD
jgi:hypothetical protein